MKIFLLFIQGDHTIKLIYVNSFMKDDNNSSRINAAYSVPNHRVETSTRVAPNKWLSSKETQFPAFPND